MLQLVVPDSQDEEFWDENNCEFVIKPGCKGGTLQLEHSLLSVSKWESKWHKVYSSPKPKTVEEIIDYIRCMTINKDARPELYDHLTIDNLQEVDKYINDPMTATKISRKPGKGTTRKEISSELIYSWMIDCEIPFSCEKWHLNRLLTLIGVCNERNAPSKKMSKKSLMKQNASLNAARRGQMHTKG